MKLLLRNILLALLGLLFFIIPIGCDERKKPSTEDAQQQVPTASSLQAIKNRGELRVGVLADKPPFSYIDKHRKANGFDVEFGKRLAKDLLGDKNRVKFIVTAHKDRLTVLNDDKVDIMLAGLSVSPQHINRVDFSQPYFKSYIAVISPIEAPITDLKQLENKTLIVTKGSAAEYYFMHYYPHIKLQTYTHDKDSFHHLVNNKGTAFASNSLLLQAWLKNNSANFMLSIPKIGSETLIAPAVKKGNRDLLRWLNSEMIHLQEEGFFHKNYDKTVSAFLGNTSNSKTSIIK